MIHLSLPIGSEKYIEARLTEVVRQFINGSKTGGFSCSIPRMFGTMNLVLLAPKNLMKKAKVNHD